jgi:hypothetical protein
VFEFDERLIRLLLTHVNHQIDDYITIKELFDFGALRFLTFSRLVHAGCFEPELRQTISFAAVNEGNFGTIAKLVSVLVFLAAFFEIN